MNSLQKTLVTIASLIVLLVMLPIVQLDSVQTFFTSQTESDITLVTIIVYALHLVQIFVVIFLQRILKIRTSWKELLIAELGWVLIWFVFLLSESITQFVFLHGYVIVLTQNISPLIFSYTIVQIIAVWGVRSE